MGYPLALSERRSGSRETQTHSLDHTHSLNHTDSITLINSSALTQSHSFTLAHSLNHTTHSLSHSITLTHTHSITLNHTRSITLTQSRSYTHTFWTRENYRLHQSAQFSCNLFHSVTISSVYLAVRIKYVIAGSGSLLISLALN